MLEVKTTLHGLLGAVAAETAVTVGHFLHGAHVYDDPSRGHVVAPALAFLVLAAALISVFAWRPRASAYWLLAVGIGVPFVGVFGLYHGAFSHGLKLLLFASGISPAQLLQLFDSPDFAMPNDLVFELTGLLTFVASAVVTWFLVRV